MSATIVRNGDELRAALSAAKPNDLIFIGPGLNPAEISQHLLMLAAKGHAYDQAVLQREIRARDERIVELEKQIDDLKRAGRS
jgi:hypothetical protein